MDSPPSAPTVKLLILLRTENVYEKATCSMSKSHIHPSPQKIKGNYVFFKVGRATKNQTFIIKEDKVEEWFGKKLKIVLEKVDQETACLESQSLFHLTGGTDTKNDAFLSAEKLTGDHVFTVKEEKVEEPSKENLGFVLELDEVEQRELRMKSRPQFKSDDKTLSQYESCQKVATKVSEFCLNNGFLDGLVKSEESISDEDHSGGLDGNNYNCSNTQFLCTRVKLETVWGSQGALSELVRDVSSLPDEESDFQQCGYPGMWNTASKWQHEITQCFLERPVEAEVCMTSENAIEGFSVPQTETKSKLPNERYEQGKHLTHLVSPEETRNLDHHMLSLSKEKPFSCVSCKAKFKRKSYLVQHERKHLDEKAFKCHHCSREFRSSAGLYCHMEIHSTVKPYKCSHCDKKFFYTQSLKQHQRGRTTIDERFSCPHCSRSYASKAYLNCHIRTHTGEMFTCSVCNATFCVRGKLNQHMNVHTGEKLLGCTFCEKKFVRKDKLTLHLRSHTGEKPFDCKQCGKKFARKDALVYHLKTHTGDDCFECLHCHRKFPKKKSLAFHLKSQINGNCKVKPYGCAHCLKRFSHRRFIIIHLKMHASD